MHYPKFSLYSTRIEFLEWSKIFFLPSLILLLGCGENRRSSASRQTGGGETIIKEGGPTVYEPIGQGKVKNSNGALMSAREAAEDARKNYLSGKEILIKPGKDAKISDVSNLKKALDESKVKFGL